MKTTARILCLFMAVLMCVSLTACGTNPIDIVKNGEFDAYPGKPFEKTLRQAVQEADGTVEKIEWQDITDEFSDVLEDGQHMIRLNFKAVMADETVDFTSTFVVNMKDKSFFPFSVAMGEEVATDYDIVMGFYDDIFGD